MLGLQTQLPFQPSDLGLSVPSSHLECHALLGDQYFWLLVTEAKAPCLCQDMVRAAPGNDISLN